MARSDSSATIRATVAADGKPVVAESKLTVVAK
jgi:hypothetical protein